MSLPFLLATGPRPSQRILATDICVFCSQRRTMAMRRAPATRKRQKPVVVTSKMQALRDLAERRMDKRVNDLPAVIPIESKRRFCRSTEAVAQAVSRNQAVFLHGFRQGYGDREVFEASQRMSNATLDELYDLTFILRNKGTLEDARMGRHLVLQCSERGHAEATIQTVASALRQDNSKRGVLRTRDVMLAMERLRTFAQQGNVRALVLEANLARHLGNMDKAIKLYERAVDLVVAGDDTNPKDKYANIQDELSSPWIELAYLHVMRGDHIKALKAYMAGLEKDDPMAYFNLARLDYHMAGNVHTHDWLYNMTKAAASGHYRAAYELGEYYANSAATPSQPQPSFTTRLKDFASFLYKPNLNLDPKTNIHHHDAFANTPELRIKLAYQWLTVARENWYISANIHLALLHLQRFIYPSGTLSAPLDPFGDQKGPGAIENPIFDPEAAMKALYEVLAACQVIPEARRISKSNVEYQIRAQPWSLHEEVLEVLEDTSLLEDLREQVETIAEAAGLDVGSTVDVREPIPHLGMLYSHNGTRGEGLYEVLDEVLDEELGKADQEALKQPRKV